MKTRLNLTPVYHSQAIQAWEKRWFQANNSSYGLMQQAALAMTQYTDQWLKQQQLQQCDILLWCGVGNNAGDGYLMACYLQQRGYTVDIFAPQPAHSADGQRAEQQAQRQKMTVYRQLPQKSYAVHIDAVFGNGLNRDLDEAAQQLIVQFNQQKGQKIAVDIPSGLNPNTGCPMPIAMRVDLTLCVMALKIGLLIGQSKNYVGKLVELPLIPTDDALQAAAYIDWQPPQLPPRQAHLHKGSFGHVLVIGGHPQMGGAVMMAGEAAIACGAGKVTVMCDARHHTAILSRSPNLMLRDIQHGDDNIFTPMDVVCFGMGLGRDAWAEQQFKRIFPQLLLQSRLHTLVIDADALWFLADKQYFNGKLPDHCILTPHSAEAARLLQCSVADIEQDRYQAIMQLRQRYGGQWVLKGAGSLSIQADEQVQICAFGNVGMATAGMGDVLSGMIGGLKAQFAKHIALADIVSLHALAGDVLARQGQRGLQAYQMPQAIYRVVNGHAE